MHGRHVLSLKLETDLDAHDEGDLDGWESWQVLSRRVHWPPRRATFLIKFGLDPIRDDQAVKKDGKNRVTLHLEPQNPSVFSGQNTG